MSKRRWALWFFFALLLTALAAAQESAPQITLSSKDTHSQPGYTATPDINVSWKLPIFNCPNGGCHIEYCLTQNPPGAEGMLSGCKWQQQLPTSYRLEKGNGTNWVYAEYRVLSGGTQNTSAPASASIVLNTDERSTGSASFRKSNPPRAASTPVALPA